LGLMSENQGDKSRALHSVIKRWSLRVGRSRHSIREEDARVRRGDTQRLVAYYKLQSVHGVVGDILSNGRALSYFQICHKSLHRLHYSRSVISPLCTALHKHFPGVAQSSNQLHFFWRKTLDSGNNKGWRTRVGEMILQIYWRDVVRLDPANMHRAWPMS